MRPSSKRPTERNVTMTGCPAGEPGSAYGMEVATTLSPSNQVEYQIVSVAPVNTTPPVVSLLLAKVQVDSTESESTIIERPDHVPLT